MRDLLGIREPTSAASGNGGSVDDVQKKREKTAYVIPAGAFVCND